MQHQSNETPNGKTRGTILIADSDFGDVEIERDIIEGAGFALSRAQAKTEDEVIEHGRDADGVLTQYARVGTKAIDAFTRCHSGR
jgi:D-3-phosphoglycerate dehydrogenase